MQNYRKPSFLGTVFLGCLFSLSSALRAGCVERSSQDLKLLKKAESWALVIAGQSQGTNTTAKLGGWPLVVQEVENNALILSYNGQGEFKEIALFENSKIKNLYPGAQISKIEVCEFPRPTTSAREESLVGQMTLEIKLPASSRTLVMIQKQMARKVLSSGLGIRETKLHFLR